MRAKSMWCTASTWCTAAVAVLLVSGYCQSAVILDSGPVGSGLVIGGSGWNTAAQVFTLDQNVQNARIDLFFTHPGDAAIYYNGWAGIRVWLMSQWGPGSDQSDVIGYATFGTDVLPGNPVFQAASLPAGDYAVVVAPNQYNWPLPSPVGWSWAIGALPGNTNKGTFDKFLMAGISTSQMANRTFPPASNFQPQNLGTNNPLALRVTGDVVPEPATMLLCGGGMIVAAATRRRS